MPPPITTTRSLINTDERFHREPYLLSKIRPHPALVNVVVLSLDLEEDRPVEHVCHPDRQPSAPRQHGDARPRLAIDLAVPPDLKLHEFQKSLVTNAPGDVF